MSNVISFETTLSIDEVFRTILTLGTSQTIKVVSEPGVGKSTLHQMLRDELGDDEWDHIYFDCTVKQDVSDIGMNIPVHDKKELEFWAAGVFQLHSPKKKVIMIDEIDKLPRMVQPMMNRLSLDHMIGELKLPAGSIVFATSNHATDNVGDSNNALLINRQNKLVMRKATGEEFAVWAGGKGIVAELRTWAVMNPGAFASYRDGGQESNRYGIFNPRKAGGAGEQFCSPRSIAACDPVFKKRKVLGEKLTKASLAGTVGAAAAESMAAFLTMANELVSAQTLLKDPEGTPMPEKIAALYITLFNLQDVIDTQDDLGSAMKFVNRVQSSEIKAVFFTTLLRDRRTVRIAKNSNDVKTWLTSRDADGVNNFDLMV